MSMMKTLARVAVGVAVAKGAQAVMNSGSGSRGSGGRGKAQAGMGGLLGALGGAALSSQGARGGAQTRSSGGGGGGGMEAMVGQLLSGGGGAAGGGLGGILGQLGGAGAAGGSGGTGGAGGIMSALAGGGAAAGLGGLMGAAMGARTGGQPSPAPRPAAAQAAQPGGFAALLNQAIARQDEPDTAPSPEDEATAALMLRAMIQAAKADGEIDAEEQARLLDHLGEGSDEDLALVRREMAAPVDPEALARETPEGLEPQVYAMALLAIEIDTREEVDFLDRFARALGLSAAAVNDIHAKMGAPALYQ